MESEGANGDDQSTVPNSSMQLPITGGPSNGEEADVSATAVKSFT
jgi:hypothetical protein